MLQKKSKGSILIMSVITFTIISLICITCSSLILSNNRISELEYKTEKLKEENLGVIELIYSNMLKEVKYTVENTEIEDEFYNYLTKNNSAIFINKVKKIENTGTTNRIIDMDFDNSLSTKEYIHYKISIKSKINNHDKYALISVKIKNPWLGKTEKKLEESDINEQEDSNIETNIENTEEEVTKINEGDLITFYNYEEK
ncbi:MAG: hypothetical protein E6356_03930 [Terrisporobacter othiniensis]|uniref:Uncharacterized protein n=2 Tax=Terrisporobacter TaxID=1505652 RepID=A0AAX2ZEQ3_9FIRM|nr:hypothetical protein [Terrisporobacter hibernicus]MDU4859586.1 hypothetical protein [Terrisporobacter othiniensis]MDU6993973.1 hypothetical protein [Terrisporobacter othiniensis]UEL46865.1 hypothetical protein JW646_14650 [Terrisporobacter hibernicus]